MCHGVCFLSGGGGGGMGEGDLAAYKNSLKLGDWFRAQHNTASRVKSGLYQTLLLPTTKERLCETQLVFFLSFLNKKNTFHTH